MSSTWIAVIGVAFALFLLNAVFAYRYRSRQLRSQGQEPPLFFVYLFFPRPWTNRVSMPRPLRVSVGIVIFVGGAAFVLGGSILLANLQLTTLSHPVGAVLALLALISLGIAIGYVGFRLIIIKNDDEPLLKRRRNEESKSSQSDAA